MKANLMSNSGGGLSEAEATAKVSETYKPDDHIRSGNGTVPLYIGQQVNDKGDIYVYIGGPAASETSWIKTNN